MYFFKFCEKKSRFQFLLGQIKILICPIGEFKISLSDIIYIIISVSFYGNRNKEGYDLVFSTGREQDEKKEIEYLIVQKDSVFVEVDIIKDKFEVYVVY